MCVWELTSFPFKADRVQFKSRIIDPKPILYAVKAVAEKPDIGG